MSTPVDQQAQAVERKKQAMYDVLTQDIDTLSMEALESARDQMRFTEMLTTKDIVQAVLRLIGKREEALALAGR